MNLQIHVGDNLPILEAMPAASVDLIYIDPPFNTGRKQTRTTLQTVRDEEHGDRTGFQGHRYRTTEVGRLSYADSFPDYLDFIDPRVEQALRLLRPHGSFFFHIDYREVHYCKVLIDSVFGRDNFMNEIIWAYDYGGRSRKRWSPKHDNILWYVRNADRYTYRFDDIDRIPYMAPGLVGPDKARRGKTPTDCWWQTIVSPNSREKTGYPSQKPLALLNRIIRVHSNPGDTVLDFLPGRAPPARPPWATDATPSWWTPARRPSKSWSGDWLSGIPKSSIPGTCRHRVSTTHDTNMADQEGGRALRWVSEPIAKIRKQQRQP